MHKIYSTVCVQKILLKRFNEDILLQAHSAAQKLYLSAKEEIVCN